MLKELNSVFCYNNLVYALNPNIEEKKWLITGEIMVTCTTTSVTNAWCFILLKM
jgi:hypothetical protein